MNWKKVMDFIGWGLILWLIGYVLGFIFFMFVPQSLIGWVIMPIGILITLWVLLKRIKSHNFNYYLYLSIFWTIIAILFDYLFIVNALIPADGYYKLDVCIYYFLTFFMPIIVGWYKNERS